MNPSSSYNYKTNSSNKQEATITSATNGNNQIIICDSFGFIHVFGRNWDAVSFKGHDGAIPLCQLARQHNLLITIGVSNLAQPQNPQLFSFCLYRKCRTKKTERFQRSRSGTSPKLQRQHYRVYVQSRRHCKNLPL